MQCKIHTNHNTRADATCKRYDICGGTEGCIASKHPRKVIKLEVNEKMENGIQAEGKAHIAEDAKAGTEAPDVRVNEAPKVKGKKTKVAKVTKKRAEASTPEPTFPAETSINQYAFMRVPAKVMTAIGIKAAKLPNGKDGFKATKVTLEAFNAATGVLTVKLA